MSCNSTIRPLLGFGYIRDLCLQKRTERSGRADLRTPWGVNYVCFLLRLDRGFESLYKPSYCTAMPFVVSCGACGVCASRRHPEHALFDITLFHPRVSPLCRISVQGVPEDAVRAPPFDL